jgi:hypothetical protein
MKSANEDHGVSMCEAGLFINAFAKNVIRKSTTELYYFTYTSRIFANHFNVRFYSAVDSYLRDSASEPGLVNRSSESPIHFIPG